MFHEIDMKYFPTPFPFLNEYNFIITLSLFNHIGLGRHNWGYMQGRLERGTCAIMKLLYLCIIVNATFI